MTAQVHLNPNGTPVPHGHHGNGQLCKRAARTFFKNKSVPSRRCKTARPTKRPVPTTTKAQLVFSRAGRSPGALALVGLCALLGLARATTGVEAVQLGVRADSDADKFFDCLTEEQHCRNSLKNGIDSGFTALQRKIRTLERENNKLKIGSNKARKGLGLASEKLKEDNAALKAENTRLKAENRQQKKDLQTVRSDYRRASAELSDCTRLQQENKRLHAEVRAFKLALNAAQKENKRLREKLRKKQAKEQKKQKKAGGKEPTGTGIPASSTESHQYGGTDPRAALAGIRKQMDEAKKRGVNVWEMRT